MESSELYTYETLDTLPLFSDPLETYSVFRNQIDSTPPPSPKIPAIDYFSLDIDLAEEPEAGDVAVDEVEEEGRPESSPPKEESVVNDAVSSERPWFRARSRFKSPMLQLHKEILDFCSFVSPTPEEEASRSAAVERVFNVVTYIWPHCNVELFGSFRTGLYLPGSDVDVVVFGSMVKTPQAGLYALARALSQKCVAKKIQVIAKARVPIIKFIESQSGIAFDISFDVQSGPKAAEFIKGVVAKIPPLKPLCLVLKIFLQQRELNEVFLGGIGSYALLTMLIAQLQLYWRRQDVLENQMTVEHNLGILLVNFFDLYGRKLNIRDVGISCNSAGIFFSKSSKGFANDERHQICIEDPQAPENDIGRSSFNYFKVKSAFGMAYSLLTDAKTIMGLGSKSILGMIIRPDTVLSQRKGGHNGDITFESLLPGSEEPVPLQIGDSGDDYYNWRLIDDEPLPREEVTEETFSYSKKKKSKSKCTSEEETERLSSSKKKDLRSRYNRSEEAIELFSSSTKKKVSKPNHRYIEDDYVSSPNGKWGESGGSRKKRKQKDCRDNCKRNDNSSQNLSRRSRHKIPVYEF